MKRWLFAVLVAGALAVSAAGSTAAHNLWVEPSGEGEPDCLFVARDPAHTLAQWDAERSAVVDFSLTRVC
jgi:hypothetical protein